MKSEYGFELLREQDIPEVNCRAGFFRHLKTGAELLSLESPEENKVFAISFRTPPPDSTGLPHILEHSVLCGSAKYPLKDPFVILLKGSLQTFLNAFTFPDKTCYPVASQNPVDFRNLIDVYVDAVFHPLITPDILRQEGWHYELDRLEDPLTIKGVVYNEMKGVFSSPDGMMAEHSLELLFPDNAYANSSGGKPEVIPELTYDAFVDFHRTHYHPSNALIYFYGDEPTSERLQLMEGYLEGFEPIVCRAEVALQPRLQEPRAFVLPYRAGQEAEGRGGMFTVNWLLDETAGAMRNYSARILEYILIGMPASPLRKALIDSGLGEDLTGVGLETEIRQMYFSTGLKGMAVEDADRVEALIYDTLRRCAAEGLDPDTVEAAFNTLEFQLRENNSSARMPRGLQMMLRSLTTWLYEGDPLELLAFEAPLQEIRDRYSRNNRYFEELIEKHFLKNPHRITLLLQPDTQLEDVEESAAREALKATKASMSEADLKRIAAETRQLKLMQERPDAPDALKSIPRLQLGDIEKEEKQTPSQLISRLDGADMLYHGLPTNDILYLDVGFDLHTLPQRLLPYVPLFGRALVEMGTEREDFVRFSQRISRKTGGISPRTMSSAVQDSPDGSVWLFLRARAMMRQADDLLDIMRDALLSVRLDDKERFRQMLLDEKSGREAALVSAGHEAVALRLHARFSEAAWAAEQMGGVSSLLFLRRLVERLDAEWPAILSDLEMIRQTLLRRGSALCNITLEESDWQGFEGSLNAFIESLPEGRAEKALWQRDALPENEGLIIPTQVNYVGKAANLYDLGYRLDGSGEVIRKYLRTTWLWEQVRVKGGAYGAFCQFDRKSGIFSFVSYRDPNLLSTLEVFDATADHLAGLNLGNEELERSIIGAIGERDTFRLPAARGLEALAGFLSKDTRQLRQQLRDEVLSTTNVDFRDFAVPLSGLRNRGSVVVLGAEAGVTAADEAEKIFAKTRRIL